MSATHCTNTSPRSRWREAPLIQVRFGPQSITAKPAGRLEPTAKAAGKPPLHLLNVAPVEPPPPVQVLTNEDVIMEIYALTKTDFNPVECDSLVLSCSPAFKDAVENDTDGEIGADRTRLAYEGTGVYWYCGVLESNHRVYVKEGGSLYIYFSDSTWWLAPVIHMGEDCQTALCRWTEHPDDDFKFTVPGPCLYCPFWEAWKKPWQKSKDAAPALQGPHVDYGPAHSVNGRIAVRLEQTLEALKTDGGDKVALQARILELENELEWATSKKPKPEDGKHGGVAVRCTSLLMAIRDEDWHKVHDESQRLLKCDSFKARIQMSPHMPYLPLLSVFHFPPWPIDAFESLA